MTEYPIEEKYIGRGGSICRLERRFGIFFLLVGNATYLVGAVFWGGMGGRACI